MKKNHRKTVWILLPNLGIGGAEVFLSSLATELDDSFNFVFFINAEKPEISLPSMKIHTHSNVYHLAFNLLYQAWRQPPNLILSSILDVNILSLLLKKLMPRHIKHVIREALPLQEACQLTKAPKVFLWLARLNYPRADAVVNLSEHLCSHLRETVPGLCSKTIITTIPNGVRKDRTSTPSMPNNAIKRIVSVGRLEHQKGYDQLIPAFFNFIKDRPNYELAIFGEGREKKHLQDLIDKYKIGSSVKLMGRTDDPIAELGRSDFFVSPSRYEGLSNAMLEALVNGVPVLATRKNTSAEDVINDKNGLLIHDCSETEIYAGLIAMDRALSLFSRSEIAQSSVKKFGIERSAKEYSKLIFDVLSTTK